MPSLFDAAADARRKTLAPLADRIRPQSFEELVGQEELVGPGKPLRALIESDNLPSMIFWGPPGTGKTTIAKIIAKETKSEFVELSAVTSGINEVRAIVKNAEVTLGYHGKRTVLFIDEIHRFNKAQQDAFLPHVERGTIILIGATTENPSFEVNAALLSRCKVFVLERIGEEGIRMIVRRALADAERGLGKMKVDLPDDVLNELVRVADGDARTALNGLELAVMSSQPLSQVGEEKAKGLGLRAKGQTGSGPQPSALSSEPDGIIHLTLDHLRSALQRTHYLYDKGGEEHYNIISALHKSMRGSDANAALYWLARMLESGEDPLYVARRLVRFASEDIGLADPNALVQAVAAYQASHQIGMPECNVILAQCVAYLAKAPKSNKLYLAYGAAAKDVREMPNLPVPLHLRNAPTKLMKELGFGKDYKYNPSFKEPVDQRYFPDDMEDRRYFG
jgi:putative ATPase